MIKAQDCLVEYNNKIASDVYEIAFVFPECAKKAYPGQFVNVLCGDGMDMPLRRPISIYDVIEDKVIMRYQVKGKGTLWLSKVKQDDFINILGPLGKGFVVDSKDEKEIIVVGGGIGIFPLYYLIKKNKIKNAHVFLGVRNSDYSEIIKPFKELDCKLYISSDDGSIGTKCYITDILEKNKMKNIKQGYICGPEIMMKKAEKILSDNKIVSQISMERRMGCGIGACLVCACKVKTKKGEEYRRACVDGPVFLSSEIIFD